MKIRFSFILVACLMSCIGTWASPIALTSPSGNIKVVVDADNDAINYSISRHGEKLITQNKLSLVLAGETLGANPRVTSVSTRLEERTLHPVVALKQSTITSRYRYAVVNFKGDYSLWSFASWTMRWLIAS